MSQCLFCAMLHAPCALLKLLFGFLDRHPFLLIKPQVKRDLQVTRTCLFLVNVIISEEMRLTYTMYQDR